MRLSKTEATGARRKVLAWATACALAACAPPPSDNGGGGGAAGGESGEDQDANISLGDVGTGGNPATPPDVGVAGAGGTGGQGGAAGGTSGGGGGQGRVTPDAGTGGTPPTPDAGLPATCEGNPIVDLNAALAATGAYEGTTAGLEGHLAASCGGAAGGEVVFAYRVARPLNHLTVRTDFPETQAPTVVYVREVCEEPVDLACNRGTAEAPGTRAVLEGVRAGLYYVIVDTGSRNGGGAFRLTVEEDGASACRDEEDNDADGLIDLADPGCELPDDDTEADPPVAPACADGLDNDSNGLTDYPNDPQCDAAGDTREGPVCGLDIPSTDVGQAGGVFPVQLPADGADLAQASCFFDAVPEHLFILSLDRASRVNVTNNSLRNAGTPVTLYARSACDQPQSELACASPWQGSLPMGELEAGVYFVFAEYTVQGGIDGGPVPFGAGVNAEIAFDVRPLHPVCSDGVDNDRDGIIDLLDPGCTGPRDQDEADEGVAPYCANGQDDDGDGNIDFPADDGCAGAGDHCEEVGFELCDGVCQDVMANARDCGTCGNVCAEGVECIDGVCGGVFLFSGYQVGLPVESLVGWEPCFSDTYGDNTPTANLRAGCDGDLVLLGCRRLGSDVLQLAAMGESVEVFADTGDGLDATHEHNGVNWYYSENTSIGFVPAGAPASRNSCDTLALPEWGAEDDGTGEGRMCWHTGGAMLNAGFRCGLTVSSDQGYERVAYTLRSPVPVRACSDGRDNDGDGRTDADDPDCMGALDDQEQADATACTDGADNDGNGLIDLDDVGCRSPWDTAEDAGDVVVAACHNEGDDDEDGAADFGADPDCLAAGDDSEAPRCGAPVDVIEVGQAGRVFAGILPTEGDDGQAGSCGDGTRRAQVFALTLDDPSTLEIAVTANGAAVATPIYIRRACDDAESEVACHFDPAARGANWRAGDFDRGLYYVFVEQGPHRTPWTVSFAVSSHIRECNDEIDNDGDEAIDAADLGCRNAFDDFEGDDPEVTPACADGVDNDEDGLTDWPDDADCVAAGDAYERALCQGGFEVGELPAVTAVYPLSFQPNQGPNRGTCGDGPTHENVYLLHLDDPSRVEIGATTGPFFGNGAYGTTYIRSACDDANSEIACAGDQFNGAAARVARLEPGDYFVFVEDSFNWPPGDPNLQPELHVTIEGLLKACENRRDDDGDGRVDALDLGCSAASDNDERDVAGQLNYCADGEDNDGDGNADYPDDDGCAAAGDPCEEVDYIQCDGTCFDGQNDPNNCGVCGLVCDPGVECIEGYCGGPVPILPNDAFGHHGMCDAWNQCNDAQGCANAACAMQGLGPAISWEEGSCAQLPNQGILCNLFFDLNRDFQFEADYRGCELPVAYHIVCAPAP